MTLRSWLFLIACLSSLFGCESIIGLPTRTLGDAGADGAGPVDDPCRKFCTRAANTCTGDYAVYHGLEDCEPACTLLTEEQLACRDQALTAAAKSSDFYLECPAASLGGSKRCDSHCKNYCNFMSQICTGDNRDPNEVEDCESKCAALVDRETAPGLAPTASRYNPGVGHDHEGDTIQCRLVHMTIASEPGQADSHCWHAAIAPRPLSNVGNPCATTLEKKTEPRCEDYCHIVTRACDGGNKVYENEKQCLAVCKALDPGNVADEAKMRDTVACRSIHAYNALTYAQPATHCQHAGPGGEHVCGEDCPAYCRLLKAGCTKTFEAAFGTGAEATMACESSCMTKHAKVELHYNVASADANTSNPVACGLLYAARALERPAEQASLCESAIGRDKCAR